MQSKKNSLLHPKVLCSYCVAMESRGLVLFHQRQPRRPIVLYQCDLVLVMLLVFLSAVHTTSSQTLTKTNGIILPNVRQQVINSGSDFSITCIFEHTDSISWTYPGYFEHQIQNSRVRRSLLDIQRDSFLTR